MRCCGAKGGAPGKGWERKAGERLKRPNGLGDREASVTALRPEIGPTLHLIANMADRTLNWIGNARARHLDFADDSAPTATAAAHRPPVIF